MLLDRRRETGMTANEINFKVAISACQKNGCISYDFIWISCDFIWILYDCTLFSSDFIWILYDLILFSYDFGGVASFFN